MKQFAIDVDFRVTKRIYVDAENEEQAEQLAKEKLDNNPYQYCTNPDACTGYDIYEVNECEEDGTESGGPLSFSELCDKICCFSVENTRNKTPDAVAEEIENYICKHGWECATEDRNTEEWLEAHPEYSEDDCETSWVADLEFLCSNEYCIEHDVDWCTFNISFFGKWGEWGVFVVEH